MNTASLASFIDRAIQALEGAPPPLDPSPGERAAQVMEAIEENGFDLAVGEVPAIYELLTPPGPGFNWPWLWAALGELTRLTGQLDSPQTYLDIIYRAAKENPNLDDRITTACATELIRRRGSYRTDPSWIMTLGRSLVTFAAPDQMIVLERFGFEELEAEGVMALMTASAIQSGLLSPLPANAMALTSSVPFGDWVPEGWQRKRIGLYIGTTIHDAIAAEYSRYHTGHLVFRNYTTIDVLARVLSAELDFDRGRLERAIGRSKPDIFDFSDEHGAPPGWVYEIKPRNAAGQAIYEAQFYADAILKASIPVEPGPPAPGTSGTVPAPNGWAIFQPGGPGAIVYDYVKADPVAIRQRDEQRRRESLERATQAALVTALEAGGEVLEDIVIPVAAALAVALVAAGLILTG